LSPEKETWDLPFHYCEFAKADERLERWKELGVGAELMLDDSRMLWPDMAWEEVLGLADRLAETGVPVSLHGPFHNLNLGARDEHIRLYSRDLIIQGFRVARSLGSARMVVHLGFLPQYPPETAEAWWRNFSETLPMVLAGARESGVLLLIENTYESDPELFERIFDRFAGEELGMCLDIGHAHCYSATPTMQWAERLRENIRHLHLSDNDGKTDIHWALGKGTTKPLPILELFARHGEYPTITLEVPFDSLDESVAVYRELCQSAIQGKVIS
jgi:sugar phosphate isomerase/epimerase